MPSSRKPTELTELIVALDFPAATPALDFTRKLEGLPVLYKVGLELFVGAGPDIVRELVHRKCRIFLDLKLHDIPNTVAKAALSAAKLHVEMLTLHLAGGSAMFRAVREELSAIPDLKPKILGVSVLTSFDDLHWGEVTRALTGHAILPAASVDGLSRQAIPWGADGLVCSPHELAAVREHSPKLYTVIPGIRPAGAKADDQARVMTPGEAHALGASAIVVGRPITGAPDPRVVATAILREIGQELSQEIR